MKLSRRNFLKLSLFGAGAGAAISIGNETTADFELVDKAIRLESVPPQFDGYRIGLVGDFHYGAYFEKAWLEHIIVRLKDAKLDLLLLCGDYGWVHDSWVEFCFPLLRNPAFSRKVARGKALAVLIMRELSSLLKEVPAKDGCFAVLGNHDRWISPSIYSSSLESIGATVLTNRFIELRRDGSSLMLVGLDDYWTGYPKVPASLPSRKSKNELRIALTHNPDLLSYLLSSGGLDFNLGLSGHTHGGQIKPPGLPLAYYNIWDRRFASGLCELSEDCKIYTTRGLGVVEIPYRIGCRPEISVLTLTTA